MKNKIALAFMAVLAFACKKEEEKKPRPIDHAQWLIGTWGTSTSEGDLSETWIKENDSVFSGTAYFIKDEDTLHSETIALNQTGDNLVYTPIVKGQNEDRPVSFRLTSATANQLVFENPSHDYPQKIVYNKITKDSMVAEISGKQQEQASRQVYPMKRK